MEKMVGKFIRISMMFYVFFVFFAQASESSIVLSVQDMNNEEIDQAMIHAHFILQVELNNFDVFNDIQHVKGLDNFKYSAPMKSANISMINGVTTNKIVYRFVLQADKKGSYALGRVFLKDKTGKMISSNKVVIKVGDEFVSTEQVQAPKYIASAKLNKKQVYVGEKISLHINFLDRVLVEELTLGIPESKKITIINAVEKSKNQLVHMYDKDYDETEWIVNLYANTAESLIIDGFQIHFLEQQLETNRQFPFASVYRNFGMMLKVDKFLAVRPIGLEVLPLPQQQGFEGVVAVGKFSKLQMALNKDSVQAGQGIVLSIDLIGDGNFEMISMAPMNLPEGFGYYDANTTKVDKNYTSKHFEFIIQAQEPGSYHIPSQTFTYFDPQDHQYKTLQSNSVAITVTENMQQLTSTDDQKKDLDVQVQQVDDHGLDSKYVILEHGSLYAEPIAMISISQYRIYLYLLFVLLLFMMLYRYIVQKYLFTHPAWLHFIIFYKATKASKKAAAQKNIVILHSIFRHLFLDLKVATAGNISDEVIEKYFKDKAFSTAQVEQWKKFNTRLLQATFAQYERIDVVNLFQDSLAWLQLLKEKI